MTIEIKKHEIEIILTSDAAGDASETISDMEDYRITGLSYSPVVTPDNGCTITLKDDSTGAIDLFVETLDTIADASVQINNWPLPPIPFPTGDLTLTAVDLGNAKSCKVIIKKEAIT